MNCFVAKYSVRHAGRQGIKQSCNFFLSDTSVYQYARHEVFCNSITSISKLKCTFKGIIDKR